MTRIVWMSGGLVAVNGSGSQVQVLSGLGGRAICTLNLPSYPALFAVLRGCGFQILGATFVLDADEATGIRSPQFRAISQAPQNIYLAYDCHQQWRQIVHHSSTCDDMLLTDISARLASGLDYSQMRLLDLAAAYGSQLRGYLHRSEPKEYQRFKDTNSPAVYKAIHALFWEMAVLRDTLAEFSAKYCFARTGITTMRGLIGSLRKQPIEHPIAKKYLSAASENDAGWLATFTAYRNLFTHSTPMEQATGVAYAVQDMRRLSPTQSIPQIYYPLPPNVADLMRRRSKGALYSTLKEMVDASSQRHHERDSEPDALDYLADCLDQIARLSLELVTYSPIAPKPIEINRDDIIGDVQIKE